MYASEAGLNEVAKRLKDYSVIPFNLEAQYSGTFSFTNAGIPIDIEANIEKAGYRVVERIPLEGRNSEYTIELATE